MYSRSSAPRPRRTISLPCSLVLCGILILTSLASAATIDLNGYRFDPLIADPDLPANLLSDPTDGRATYLVQLAGPVEQTWKDELTTRGVGFHGYVPENTFIVRMEASALEGITNVAAR